MTEQILLYAYAEVSKETYLYDKRDLITWQKSPTNKVLPQQSNAHVCVSVCLCIHVYMYYVRCMCKSPHGTTRRGS